MVKSFGNTHRLFEGSEVARERALTAPRPTWQAEGKNSGNTHNEHNG
jgi:hypothetical protein